MFIELLTQIVMLSIFFVAIYLLISLLHHRTSSSLSAKWHYYLRVSLYVFLLLPGYEVISRIFYGATGSRLVLITDNLIPMQMVQNTMSSWFHIQSIFSLSFLPYVWMAGSILFIACYFIERFRCKSYMIRTCKMVQDDELWNEFENCKIKIGVSTKISLYTSPYITSPFLFGIFRPLIVLPKNISFTPTELQHIFLHELTHWKRRDPWLNCLLMLIHAVHWFNPCIYFIRRDIDRFCELSCDESVTRSMNKEERRSYCALLLKVLWNVADQHSKLYSAFSSTKLKQLEGRLDMVMKKESTHKLKRTGGMFIWITMVAVLIGAVSVHAAIETNTKAGYTPNQTVHQYVEGEQSSSAAASFDSTSEFYTSAQTVHEPIEGEQSISVPTSN